MDIAQLMGVLYSRPTGGHNQVLIQSLFSSYTRPGLDRENDGYRKGLCKIFERVCSIPFSNNEHFNQ